MVKSPTRWWLIRHAPTPDPLGRITGQWDVDCDLSDEDDLAAVRKRLPFPACVIESGLRRSHQTAQALGLTPHLVEPLLQEQNFGLWQGRSWTDLEREKADGLREFWASPAYTTPPQGESFQDVCRRVAGRLESLSTDHAGKDIIAILHAGSIRAALAHALSLSPDQALRFTIRPLTVTRLDYLDGEWWVDMVSAL